ncbi:MAG: winged helix-turn-helix domain-containing protein [Acidilobaceae archaeon]
MKAERELTSTSLKIYVLLLEAGEPLGVREIARAIDMPASTVHYHLKKLEELDLVEAAGLGYRVKRLLPIEGFSLIGKRLVPKLIIYSLFFLGVALGEVIVVIYRGWIGYEALVIVLTSLLAFLVLFKEGYELRRRLLG